MSIPAPIIAACVFVFLLFAVLMFTMTSEASRVCRSLESLTTVFQEAARGSANEHRSGLITPRLAHLRSACIKLPNPMRSWWFRIEDSLVQYVNADGVEEWYLTSPAREVLTEESVSERYYHSSFYQAVPGILTGLGLTATFVSILIALAGLHVTVLNDTETVTGIKELIEGLSGKFLSSIAGLVLSIVFLFVERKWCERRLTGAFEDLVDAVAHLIPTITPARVQIETQVLMARQCASLAAIEAMASGQPQAAPAPNGFVPRMAAILATDMEQFAIKLEELESALNRGIRQLLQ
jgi:hypothetical protein